MQIYAHASSSGPCPPCKQGLKDGLNDFSSTFKHKHLQDKKLLHFPSFLLSLTPPPPPPPPHIHAPWWYGRSGTGGTRAPGHLSCPHLSPCATPLKRILSPSSGLSRAKPPVPPPSSCVRFRSSCPGSTVLLTPVHLDLGQSCSEGVPYCPGNGGVSSCSHCDFVSGQQHREGNSTWPCNSSLGAQVVLPWLPRFPWPC